MTLAEKKCVPCEGGVEPLSRDEAQQKLSEVPGWEIEDGWLRRKFDFKDFKEALEFVNQVGEIAESEGHHPDIAFGWGYAEIKLQTHAIGGLHENDFIVAAKVDALEG